MTALCSNCEFRSATKRCEECTELFCFECSSFHSKVKQFRTHINFTDYSEKQNKLASLCCNCDTAVAKFQCVDCRRQGLDSTLYCLGCSIIHPKVKPFFHHSMESFLGPSGNKINSSNTNRRNKKSCSTVSFASTEQDMTIEEDQVDVPPNSVLAWASSCVDKLEMLLVPKNGSVILEDKRSVFLVAGVCLGGYLLLKRLLGRQVSVVIAIGCMIGLRWFQKRTNKVQDLDQSRLFDQAALDATRPSKTTASDGGRGGPGPSGVPTTTLRSLAAATASISASDLQFQDEFWHTSNMTKKKPIPAMRVRLKDGGAAPFNPASDT